MEKVVDYQGANICYHVYGEGENVVLLHGFAEDSSIWSRQINSLKPFCRLIIPDLPGSGKSTMLHTPTISMEDYARSIQVILSHENIAQCIMLGHSMGGYVTLAFAALFPGHLRGFGLVHSTAFADDATKKENRKKGIELMRQYGTYAFLKNTTPNLFSARFKKYHEDEISGLIEQGKNFTTEVLVQYYTAMLSRVDRTSLLTNSHVPVLFILGDEDVAAPLTDLLQQVHLPKTSVVHILEGVGHMGMWEAPEQLSTHLLSYIQSIAANN